MPSQKIIAAVIIAFSLILSVAFYIFLLKEHLNRKTLPMMGRVSNFQLIDTQGKDITLKDLKGKIWVVDFIFTTCGGICPMMSQNMARLYEHFHGDNRVHFVSISVNPENDTPEVLAEYAKRYSADPNRWHFLTGPREMIEQLAVSGFKVGSAKEPVFHSAYFILVDTQGLIRQYYEGTQKESIGKIKTDIEILLQEKIR